MKKLGSICGSIKTGQVCHRKPFQEVKCILRERNKHYPASCFSPFFHPLLSSLHDFHIRFKRVLEESSWQEKSWGKVKLYHPLLTQADSSLNDINSNIQIFYFARYFTLLSMFHTNFVNYLFSITEEMLELVSPHSNTSIRDFQI